MYTLIDHISEDSLAVLVEVVKGNESKFARHSDDGSNYLAWRGSEEIKHLVPSEITERFPLPWVACMFLTVPPQGSLHSHKDGHLLKAHIVVETNDKAISVNGEFSGNLELGGIYDMEGGLEHSARNDGETNRTHLVIML